MTTPKDKRTHGVGTSEPGDQDIPLHDPRWAVGVKARLFARAEDARRSNPGERIDVERGGFPDDVALTPAPPIRAAYLAMSRDALIAHIAEIASRPNYTLQIAHRNLSGLSDNDLRRLLETITPESE